MNIEEKNEALQDEEKAPAACDKEEKEKDKGCEKEKKCSKKELAKLQKELEEVKDELEKAKAEKDAAYTAALSDVITEILPVVDTLELALKYGTEGEQMTKGVEMTLAKFTEVLEKLGVTLIETETFDPNFHNAVMHVEDDQYGDGQIVEVFQKGYKKGEKIIRYAMVKVAN